MANPELIIQQWNGGSTSALKQVASWLYPKMPQVGMVVGTHAAVPYIHLQLEARRRFYPHIPMLVHDDGSHKIASLGALCQEYGCAFEYNNQRHLSCLGDLSAFVGGLVWAKNLSLDILVKVSRRWLFQTNWEPSLKALAVQSQYATIGSYTTSFNFGFRTECVGLAVNDWRDRTFMDDAMNHIARGRSVFVEAYLHDYARRFERMNCQTAEQWREAHPMPADRNGYALWPLLGTDRCARSPYFLWHDSSAPGDYFNTALEWGLPYTADDFADPDQSSDLYCDSASSSSSSVGFPMPLGDIYARSYESLTDKGTAHSYLAVYEKLLASYRHRNVTLLEIGVWCGGSLLLWAEYFASASIIGIDTDLSHLFPAVLQCPRIRLIEGDATVATFIDRTVDAIDIVIDDGSHIVDDQLASFKAIMPKLAPGGLYVIEDISSYENALHLNREIPGSEIIDRRTIKGRFDDILLVFSKST